jgi:hypothetical protein
MRNYKITKEGVTVRRPLGYHLASCEILFRINGLREKCDSTFMKLFNSKPEKNKFRQFIK